MPPAPIQQSAAPPPPPPPSPPSADLPSWVAQSEVERLAKEKQERDALAAHAALPQMPLPPELDWRQVGQRMKYSRPQRVYAEWQIGPLSAVLYLLLYLVCWPASVVFVWRSGWRFTTKVIVVVVSIVGPVLLAFFILARR
jgi:hypothetical protein